MAGAMLFGLLFGLVIGLLQAFSFPPEGWAVFWALSAGQLAWAARTCWRRTGLPYATAAMVWGAVVSSVFAGLPLAGHPFPELARTWWLPLVLAGIAGPVLFQVESRVHPAQWRRWRDFMDDSTLWDLLTMRHIPNLRGATAPTPPRSREV